VELLEPGWFAGNAAIDENSGMHAFRCFFYGLGDFCKKESISFKLESIFLYSASIPDIPDSKWTGLESNTRFGSKISQ
jgi:hypothetical protein